MIDKEAERAVSGWLRTGDKAAGRKPAEGRCDRCAENGYLSDAGKQRLCARCYLERREAAL